MLKAILRFFTSLNSTPSIETTSLRGNVTPSRATISPTGALAPIASTITSPKNLMTLSALESRVMMSVSGDPMPAAVAWGVEVASSKTSVNVTWQDISTGQTGFEIDRGISKGQMVPIATVGPNTTSFKDTPPKSGVDFYYTVRGYSAYGTTDAPAAASGELAISSSQVSSFGSTASDKAKQKSEAAAAQKAAAAAATAKALEVKAAQFNEAAAKADAEDNAMLAAKSAAAAKAAAAAAAKTKKTTTTSTSTASTGSTKKKKPTTTATTTATTTSTSSTGSSTKKKKKTPTPTTTTTTTTTTSPTTTSTTTTPTKKKKKPTTTTTTPTTTTSSGSTTGKTSPGISSGSGDDTAAPIQTPGDATVIHVGPGEDVSTINAALAKTGPGRSYDIIVDPGTYSMAHRAIYGNVTITAADDSDEPTLQIGGDNYPTLYVNGNLVINHVKTQGGMHTILMGSTVGANINAQDVTMTDGGAVWIGSGGNNIYMSDNDVLGNTYKYVYGNFNETVDDCTIDNSGDSNPVKQGGTGTGSNVSGEAAIRVMDVNDLTLIGVKTTPYFYLPGQEWKQDIQLRPSAKLIRLIDCSFYQPDVGDMTWRSPAHPVDEVDFINCTITKSIKLEAGADLVKIENTTIAGRMTNTTESFA